VITLGQVYVDNFTGFRGIAEARTEYLFGCIQVKLLSKSFNEKGEEVTRWFDEQRLTSKSKALVGGPHDHPPERDHSGR